MRTSKKISIAGGPITLIAVFLLLAMVPLLNAQQFNYKDITRSKLWARIWNTSGVGQPTATWGTMLEGATKYIETAPWLWFFPGLMILLTVLAINFVGDGLRDALDPRTMVE